MSLSIGIWNANAICCAIRGQPQWGLRFRLGILGIVIVPNELFGQPERITV